MFATAKRKKAAALGYEAATDRAPKVLAAGAGAIAEKILDIAKIHQVPIHHDPELAGLLASLQVGQYIPPELYKLVAEVLAFIYEIDEHYGLKPKKQG